MYCLSAEMGNEQGGFIFPVHHYAPNIKFNKISHCFFLSISDCVVEPLSYLYAKLQNFSSIKRNISLTCSFYLSISHIQHHFQE